MINRKLKVVNIQNLQVVINIQQEYYFKLWIVKTIFETTPISGNLKEQF